MTGPAPSPTLRDALRHYFARSGLPPDGGYGARWVVVRAGRIPISVFPNTRARRRAVPLHDIHHVLTGYDTSLRGEAEIGAWELGSGCRNYPAAWLLDAGAALLGLLLWPRATLRAYRRGRRERNLYAEGYREELLDERVEALRRRLGLGPA